jgi:uncharacterized protein DUF4189
MRYFLKTSFAAIALASVSAGAAFAWGAIAVDDHDGEDPGEAGYALITDSPSRNAASIEALSSCQANGSSDCRLVLTFQKCGAYAASRNLYGAGTGNTVAEAEKRALASCNDPFCTVIVSDCQ